METLEHWLDRWGQWLDTVLAGGVMSLSQQSRVMIATWLIETEDLGFQTLVDLGNELLSCEDATVRASVVLKLNVLHEMYRRQLALDSVLYNDLDE